MAAVPLKANAAVRDDLMLAHADVDVPKLVPSRAGVIQAEIDAVLEHGGRAGSFPAEQTIEVKALGKRVLSQDADMEWAPPRKHASDLYASLSAVVKTLDTATRRQLAEIENLPIAARKGRKIELDAATFLELFNAHVAATEFRSTKNKKAAQAKAAKSQQQLDIEIPGDGRAGEPEPLKPTRSVVTDVARQYIGAPSNDPLLVQAKSLVIEDQRASLSYLQRKLRIGYNRAAAIIEELHRVGVISNPNEQGVRSVLAQAQA